MVVNLRGALVAIATVPLQLLPLVLHAQTAQTAQQHLRIHVYGLFSYARPDYATSSRASGATVGGSFDGIRVLPYTDLGLEVRGVTTHAYDINESSFSGGPRVSFSRYRLQPYAEYMFGIGRGNFNHPSSDDYSRDYTAIRSYGGGFTYGLTRNFDLQGDVQRQRWRFSYVLPYFHPVQASVGVRYRLHFRSRTGPQ